MNKGEQNAIVTNSVLIISETNSEEQPLLFEQFERLPAKFSPNETGIKTRFFRNGPYPKDQFKLNSNYEIILLGFTDDSYQPTFGIRFLTTFIIPGEFEPASFIKNSDDFDRLLKLKKKLGPCKPKRFSKPEIERVKSWQGKIFPRSLLGSVCAG
mgnify:CR=1 FL=1